MFAVVKIGSSQFLVSPGQEILIDFQGKTAPALTFDQVLLLVDDRNVTVGKPLVAGAVVTAEVKDHPKGEKIRIGKFKAKSRYRLVRGFRPHYTRVKITEILAAGSQKTAAPVVAAKTPAVRAKRVKKVS